MVIQQVYAVYANIAFYCLLIPWSALWTVLVLITMAARCKTPVKGMLWIWANGLFWFLGKPVHAEGLAHIDKKKNYLLLINHTSMFDFPAIMAVFPRVAWLGRDNLLRIPVFGTTLTMIDYIAIFPGDLEKSKKSIEAAVGKSESLHIAMFPEGTRTLDGSLGDFKKGFTYIVRNTSLDVLPVTINGLFSWKPKYQHHITPFKKIKLIIHKPVHNTALRKLSNDEMASHMKSIINHGLSGELS